MLYENQCFGSVSFWATRILSGYVSQRCGFKSGSFHHQAKIVRKTLISTVLWLLYDFLSLKNDVNVSLKSNKQKTIFVGVLKVTDEKSRIWIRGSVSHRSTISDSGLYQNITDPKYWIESCLDVMASSRRVCKSLEKKNVPTAPSICHFYMYFRIHVLKYLGVVRRTNNCLSNRQIISFLQDFSQFNVNVAFAFFWLFSCECRVEFMPVPVGSPQANHRENHQKAPLLMLWPKWSGGCEYCGSNKLGFLHSW